MRYDEEKTCGREKKKEERGRQRLVGEISIRNYECDEVVMNGREVVHDIL